MTGARRMPCLTQRLALGGLIGLVALITAAPLLAGDGGGRSVFATGAGNRALGLGGAYAGCTDDASALLWNSAGLGLVTRRELQVTQTTLFGLDFSEQYASFVLPHWRWGTVGVTWRRFGVSGIEGRDDRGFVTDDDLRDAETELILGHGRSVLDGDLAYGFGLKLRRHELAGHADTGLGLDVGLWGRPLALAGLETAAARRLATGIAVRNAAEPQIKLSEDSVPDPIALRAGLAWTQPLGGRLAVLAVCDLEQTRGMDRRLHAGLECSLEDLLAVRLGSSDGRLTAGFGLRWQDVRADYQFEDHVLQSVHRFGLSLAFGPTVSESRRRAHAAAEAALQARLDEAFAADNQQREAALLARVRAELAAEQWRAAIAALGSLEVLAPDHPQRSPLAVAAWSGLARQQETSGDLIDAALSWRRVLAHDPDDRTVGEELARVQAESDRRSQRSREIRQRWEVALDAVARGDLEAASAGFAAVLELAPADHDARRMLEHTRQTLAGRAATAALLPADPGPTADPDPGAGSDEAARAPRPPVASPARPAPPPTTAAAEITPQRRRELDDLYRRGLDAMAAGRRTEAVRFWEVVFAADPTHAHVRDDLTREYLAQGLEAFTAGALRAAVASWEEAVRVDPQDPRARGYLERALQQLARMEQISGNR